MPSLQSFASNLLEALPDLQVTWSRGATAADGAPPASREVVGIGVAAGPMRPHRALHKGPGLSISASYARQVASPATTKASSGRPPEDLRQTVARLGFVVKDASPDTLLTVALCIAHEHDPALAPAFDPWQAAVDQWDAGHMSSTPERSWPALASIRAHTLFPDWPGEREPVEAMHIEAFARAWMTSFRFLLETMASGEDPTQLVTPARGEARHALADLRRLEQVYRDALEHATITQLPVPVLDAPHRQVIVDTLLVVEHEGTDALKLFARTDAKRAPGGKGFGLVVSYRPQGEDWNRFTIHSDPALRLDLTRLWVHLERQETKAYTSTSGDIDRPAGNEIARATLPSRTPAVTSITADQWPRVIARQGVARPLDRVDNAWINPWYLNSDASLIASPGKDADGAPAPGTRLAWSDILDSVWQTFTPLDGIELVALTRGSGDELVASPPVALPAAPLLIPAPPDARRRIRLLRWPRDADANHAPRGSAVELSSTARSVLAAVAQRAPGATVGLSDLIPDASMLQIKLVGGFAVATTGGCIVIDDWRDQDLQLPAIANALTTADQLCTDADDIGAAARRLAERLDELLAGDIHDPFSRRLDEILRATSRQRVLLAQAQTTDAQARRQRDDNAQRLYVELVKFWGGQESLDRAEAGLARIEQAVRATIESRTGYAVRRLGVLALSATLAGAITRPGLEILNDLAYRLALAAGITPIQGGTAVTLTYLGQILLFLSLVIAFNALLRRYLLAPTDSA